MVSASPYIKSHDRNDHNFTICDVGENKVENLGSLCVETRFEPCGGKKNTAPGFRLGFLFSSHELWQATDQHVLFVPIFIDNPYYSFFAKVSMRVRGGGTQTCCPLVGSDSRCQSDILSVSGFVLNPGVMGIWITGIGIATCSSLFQGSR